MHGTAVEAITALAQQAAGKTHVIDGVTYSTVPLHDVRKAVPEPKAVAVHTLTGLVGLIPHLEDDKDWTPLLVHVVSHAEVRIVPQGLSGFHQQRPALAIAAFESLFGGSFQFGRFMPAEEFVIGLQSLFVHENDAAAVLALVGNLREEAVRTTDDNGVTQTVTARQGVAFNAERELPNPVTLRPFRTFREIEQPASKFILRAKGGGNGQQPQLALFEADGGQWKADAIVSIVEYLTNAIAGHEDIAEDTPVIG